MIEFKEQYPRTPNYWVRNIKLLEQVLEGNTVYFDMTLPQFDIGSNEPSFCLRVFICDVPRTDKRWNERRIDMFHFEWKSWKDKIHQQYGLEGVSPISYFWEPSVVASVLTVLGFEVLYGSYGGTGYISYSEGLVFRHQIEDNDDEMDAVPTTVANSPDKSRCHYAKFLSEEELHARSPENE